MEIDLDWGRPEIRPEHPDQPYPPEDPGFVPCPEEREGVEPSERRHYDLRPRRNRNPDPNFKYNDGESDESNYADMHVEPNREQRDPGLTDSALDYLGPAGGEPAEIITDPARLAEAEEQWRNRTPLSRANNDQMIPRRRQPELESMLALANQQAHWEALRQERQRLDNFQPGGHQIDIPFLPSESLQPEPNTDPEPDDEDPNVDPERNYWLRPRGLKPIGLAATEPAIDYKTRRGSKAWQPTSFPPWGRPLKKNAPFAPWAIGPRPFRVTKHYPGYRGKSHIDWNGRKRPCRHPWHWDLSHDRWAYDNCPSHYHPVFSQDTEYVTMTPTVKGSQAPEPPARQPRAFSESDTDWMTVTLPMDPPETRWGRCPYWQSESLHQWLGEYRNKYPDQEDPTEFKHLQTLPTGVNPSWNPNLTSDDKPDDEDSDDESDDDSSKYGGDAPLSPGDGPPSFADPTTNWIPMYWNPKSPLPPQQDWVPRQPPQSAQKKAETREPKKQPKESPKNRSRTFSTRYLQPDPEVHVHMPQAPLIPGLRLPPTPGKERKPRPPDSAYQLETQHRWRPTACGSEQYSTLPAQSRLMPPNPEHPRGKRHRDTFAPKTPSEYDKAVGRETYRKLCKKPPVPPPTPSVQPPETTDGLHNETNDRRPGTDRTRVRRGTVSAGGGREGTQGTQSYPETFVRDDTAPVCDWSDISIKFQSFKDLADQGVQVGNSNTSQQVTTKAETDVTYPTSYQPYKSELSESKVRVDGDTTIGYRPPTTIPRATPENHDDDLAGNFGTPEIKTAASPGDIGPPGAAPTHDSTNPWPNAIGPPGADLETSSRNTDPAGTDNRSMVEILLGPDWQEEIKTEETSSGPAVTMSDTSDPEDTEATADDDEGSTDNDEPDEQPDPAVTGPTSEEARARPNDIGPPGADGASRGGVGIGPGSNTGTRR